jgi:hypothetical protein
MTKCQGKVALYRFYNFEKSMHGEPFALCSAHIKEQPIPQGCILSMIAKEAISECVKKDDE